MFGAYLPGIDEAAGVIGQWLTNKQNLALTQEANTSARELLAEQNAFNSAEAEKQRHWEETMSNTAYQRAREDMEAAGINPILLGSSAQAASTPQGYAASSAASHAQQTPTFGNIILAGLNSGNAANKQFNDNVNTVFNALGKLL